MDGWVADQKAVEPSAHGITPPTYGSATDVSPPLEAGFCDVRKVGTPEVRYPTLPQPTA